MMSVRDTAAQWRIVPELRVTGGEESDLLVDPQIVGGVVPGGPFAEIAPSLVARHWMGGRGLVRLNGFATLQRFLNEESRLVYAHTVSGDALWNFGHSMRGRLSLATDFFDDSERETVRRLGLSGELGLAVVRHAWNAELWGGARGRRYPNVDVLDSSQRLSTYGEVAWSGGTALRFVPNERVDLGVDGLVQQTDARDAFFDSQSWTVSGSANARLISTLYGSLFGAWQDRRFTERAPEEDHDEYWQTGAGLRYAFADGWDVALRWGYSLYTWPDGTEENSHRLAVDIRYAWGRQAPPVPRVDVQTLVREGGGTFKRQDPRGNVGFRVLAPGAAAVSVAGSFNDWSTAAIPMQPASGGWWEARIVLAPGTYEYAYVIDGQWTTPPEALLTVEDGFGGTNGILEVLPSDV